MEKAEGKYIVLDESTLGHLIPGRFPSIGPLARIKSGHGPFDGPVLLPVDPETFARTVRPATKADFERFRVWLPPDHPEFDPAAHAEALRRLRETRDAP